MLSEIAKRTDEDIYDLGRYYLIEDIERLLFGKKLSKEEKINRKQCFIGLWKDGRIIFLSGKRAEKIAKKELGELYEIKDTNEFIGTVVGPGKITAIARILWSNDIELDRRFRTNFKKGQILVTQMTQPNIVDIASRAGAIITDEGGLLSHAAIISREFKIPCIVGTHIATDIIKDGDLVEVDANKGVIKILKRQK